MDQTCPTIESPTSLFMLLLAGLNLLNHKAIPFQRMTTSNDQMTLGSLLYIQFVFCTPITLPVPYCPHTRFSKKGNFGATDFRQEMLNGSLAPSVYDDTASIPLGIISSVYSETASIWGKNLISFPRHGITIRGSKHKAVKGSIILI